MAKNETETKSKPETKKTSIFDKYAVDVDAEAEGMWVELALDETIQVKVRSSECEQFKRAIHRNNKKNARLINKKDKDKTFEDVKRLNDTLALTAIQYLLIDWRGFIGEDGKDIPFSIEAAKTVLLDERMRNLLDEVVEAATTPETFRSFDEGEAEELIQGN